MIEIIRTVQRGTIRSVLFDFDGTLSLIREGWQEVMISFMTEILLELDASCPPEDLRRHVNEYVTRLTGKQTIYQMIQLTEEVRLRGGQPEDPLVYKHRYHDRLWQRIQERIEGLQSGKYRPPDWLVSGSVDLLNNLRNRGIRMFLASGTDEAFVKQEVDLLALTPFFDGRVYGAQDQHRLFSKRMVIQRVLTEGNLKDSEFVAFGDGYVEIENTREVGGVAVGVATDERLRSGRVDRWKRERLIAAGADIIIPDFTAHERLIGFLSGEIDEV
jgi:phosphoglycolate phosphatase